MPARRNHRQRDTHQKEALEGIRRLLDLATGSRIRDVLTPQNR